MFQNPLERRETLDPDDEKGLHYEEKGFGWEFIWVRGYLTEGNPDPMWTGPYGGTYHRVAGWPFHALRSRVEVLDSQVSGRSFEGEPMPEVREQRRRWELPWKEIFYRGIASKDLPSWLGADPGRRLPLIPMPLGLAGDAILYSVLFLFAQWGGSFVLAHLCRGRRG